MKRFNATPVGVHYHQDNPPMGVIFHAVDMQSAIDKIELLYDETYQWKITELPHEQLQSTLR